MNFRQQIAARTEKTLISTFVLVFALSCISPATLVNAQERVQRSPSILEFFGIAKPKPNRIVKAPKKRSKKVSSAKIERRKKQTTARSATVRGGNIATGNNPLSVHSLPVVKLENAKTVLVVGDFMAGGVAEGLTDAFASSPDVKIVDKWNGSSGFVRDDYYNWPASLPMILTETKPTVVIVMIGTNDRQQMLIGDTRESVGTPAWISEYEKRVVAMALALRTGAAPVIWVGEPAHRSSQMSASMTVFNDIYRKNVEAIGGTFVDIWDGFVDENGVFQQSGVDMNGLPARLRGSDGISFSKAGKRKAAFYVEKPLRQLLGETLAPATTALTPQSVGPLLREPVIITRTDPIGLNDPELDGGSELLGASPNPINAGVNKSLGNASIPDGIAPEPRLGRVDDFTWKDPAQAELVTPDDDTTDKTGATK